MVRKTTYAARIDGKVVGKTEVQDSMPFMENLKLPYAVISRAKEAREQVDPRTNVVRNVQKDEVTCVKFFADKGSAEKYKAKVDAIPTNKNYRAIVTTEIL